MSKYTENDLYSMYIDWLFSNHPDCPYIQKYGPDDGSLIAYEKEYLWDDFEDYLNL